MGPRPGDHPAVWLAERARLPHSSESAAAALRLTSPRLRGMRLSRPVTHPAWPHPAGCVRLPAGGSPMTADGPLASPATPPNESPLMLDIRGERPPHPLPKHHSTT